MMNHKPDWTTWNFAPCIQHHCKLQLLCYTSAVSLWQHLHLIHTTTFQASTTEIFGIIVFFFPFKQVYSWKPFNLLLALPSLGYFKDKEALVKQKRLWCMKQYLKRPSVATCIKALGIYTIKLVSQYLITQLYRAAVCMHIVIT